MYHVANHVVSMIGFTDFLNQFIAFVILVKFHAVKLKTLMLFFTRLCQSFSLICCSFPDILEQLKKNAKFSAIGYTLQLVEEIWETAVNTGETFTQSCAKKYEGFFCTLPHEI